MFLFIEAIVWVILIVMTFFDYRRSLPTAWYVHKLIWGFSTLFNAAGLTFHMIKTKKKSNLLLDEVFYLLLLQTIGATALFILGFVYPFDKPHSARRFVDKPLKEVEVTLLEDRESEISFNGDVMSQTQNRDSVVSYRVNHLVRLEQLTLVARVSPDF